MLPVFPAERCLFLRLFSRTGSSQVRNGRCAMFAGRNRAKQYVEQQRTFPPPGMKQHNDTRENSSPPAKPAEAPLALSIAVVYQDAQCRQWVAELCDQVNELISAQAVQSVFWSIAGLDQPGAFQKAVSAASQADVIMVSLRAAEAVPPRFYAWAEAWSGCRQRPNGTLIALVGLPGRSTVPSEHLQEYLRIVARQAGMEYLLRELAVTPPRVPEMAQNQPAP